MFSIEITHNLDEISSDLDEIRQKIANLSKFHRERVIPMLHREIDEIFEEEPWVSLHPRYAAWKAKRYPGQTILKLKGDLHRSYTQSNAPGAIREISGMDLDFGTNIEYAAYHEYEDLAENIPQREVIGNLPDNLDEIIGTELEFYIDEAIEDFNNG